MTEFIYQNEDKYWACCPCECDLVELYYGRIDDGGGGWIYFDLEGNINVSSGDDSGGEIYFEGTYLDSGTPYDVLLAWDPAVGKWYINDGGFTFEGPSTRCDAVGSYDSVFEVAATAWV